MLFMESKEIEVALSHMLRRQSISRSVSRNTDQSGM